MLFQQDNARPHMAAAMQHALYSVQQLPWPARSPDLLPVEHVWDMMKPELTLSPEPATTIAKLQQQVQDAWDNLSQDDIQHLYECLHVRIHACVVIRGSTLYIAVTVWAPLTVTCVSFGLSLLYAPTMINYLSHQFSIQ